MTESAQGPNSASSPHEQYITEFKKSAHLFEDALKEYQQTPADEVVKRQAFKEVMDRALQVMSETAMETCRKSNQQQLEKKLEEDYQKFEKDYNDKNKEALNKDYENLLKDIHDLNSSFGS